MAKTDAINIFLSDETTEDKLTETYAEVVDMVQKGAISSLLKNTNLSGDPQAGSVEVRRLMTSAAKTYGTARTASEGDLVANNGVTINLNVDKEIVEELEWKDIQFYGIPDIMGKRSKNHQLAMIRDLDNAFFTEAEAEGTSKTVTGDTIVDKLEALIQEIETVSNDNVDGVDRDLISITLLPEYYGQLWNKVDTLPNPRDGGVSPAYFHGVRVFSNTRQTEDAIIMVDGAIGQPVVASPYTMERVPFSTSIAVELFYNYGTEAVMSDLIMYASLADASA